MTTGCVCELSSIRNFITKPTVIQSDIIAQTPMFWLKIYSESAFNVAKSTLWNT